MGNVEGLDFKRKRLENYLDIFFVKPSNDKKFNDFTADIYKMDSYSKGVQFKNKKELLEFGMVYILSYGRRVIFEAVNTYSLIERYFSNETLLNTTLIPELLIIYHGFNEFPNKELPTLTAQIISNRELRRKQTLFLTLKKDIPLSFEVVSYSTNSMEMKGDL